MPGASWGGSQFLQADRKGRLFLLRGETLEIFPLGSSGKLGEGKALPSANPRSPGGECTVVGAAMSRGGDWLIQDGAELLVFRGAKEEPVEKLPWFVSAAGFVDDDPVVAGSPRAVDKAAAGLAPLSGPQGFLAHWSAGHWGTLVPAIDKGKESDPRALMERRMVRLASASNGHLWMAFDYEHRFREYSPGGRLLTEIVVGRGEARRAEDAESRQKLADDEARRMSKEGHRVKIFEVTAEPATEALAEGRDGRMYFLVLGGGDGESGVALERFDAVNGSLERLPLAMPDPGRGTMAAGRDGLYVAAYSAKRGIWRLTWDDLDQATWTEVEARISSGQGGGSQGPPLPKVKAASAPRTARKPAPAAKSIVQAPARG